MFSASTRRWIWPSRPRSSRSNAVRPHQMATVEVTFTPLPAHVRTARLVPTASSAPFGGDSGNGAGHAHLVEVAHEEDDGVIPAGFGLAVISGLADDVHVSSTSYGVSVRMSWPSAVRA